MPDIDPVTEPVVADLDSKDKVDLQAGAKKIAAFATMVDDAITPLDETALIGNIDDVPNPKGTPPPVLPSAFSALADHEKLQNAPDVVDIPEEVVSHNQGSSAELGNKLPFLMMILGNFDPWQYLMSAGDPFCLCSDLLHGRVPNQEFRRVFPTPLQSTVIPKPGRSGGAILPSWRTGVSGAKEVDSTTATKEPTTSAPGRPNFDPAT